MTKLVELVCLLWSSFLPWDVVARQINDWEFSHTQGFNLGKGQMQHELAREDRREKNGVPQPV